MGLKMKENTRSPVVKEVWNGWNLEFVKVQMRRSKRVAGHGAFQAMLSLDLIL